MATATELLRVAEHMRANVLHDAVGVSYVAAALALEREAKRLQAIEAQQHSGCVECGGDLGGTHLGRLEEHKPNCSRFPL